MRPGVTNGVGVVIRAGVRGWVRFLRREPCPDEAVAEKLAGSQGNVNEDLLRYSCKQQTKL